MTEQPKNSVPNAVKGFLGRSAGRTGSSLLGLAFESGRLECVVVKRTNGSVAVNRSFSTALSLNPLTDDAELVGREIRKHLDQAGIRERRCAVCVPSSWALTLLAPAPDLPDSDIESFLQIEAERGFPCDPETLLVARGRLADVDGERYALLVAVPKHHLSRLESVLVAAQLRPVTFSLGITAIESASADSDALALLPGGDSITLLVKAGGGPVVLRTLEAGGAVETGPQQVDTGQVARDVRITLGQLPPRLRERIKLGRIHVLGAASRELAEELRPRLLELGIDVEITKECGACDFGARLAGHPPVSAALALAASRLTGGGAGFEFLAPKVSAWQRLVDRYSSRRLVWAGAAGGVAAALVALAFLVQQALIWHWTAKWEAMQPRVAELEDIQKLRKRFRPWFDESARSLSVLKRLTEAFPEDGSVSAKTVEIREPATITCTGTARDRQALLKLLDKLRAAHEVADVKVEQMRGRSPLEFTFNFRWGGGGGR